MHQIKQRGEAEHIDKANTIQPKYSSCRQCSLLRATAQNPPVLRSGVFMWDGNEIANFQIIQVQLKGTWVYWLQVCVCVFPVSVTKMLDMKFPRNMPIFEHGMV